MSKKEEQKEEPKNALWIPLSFRFPRIQEKGEAYVKKSVRYRVYLDSKLIGEIKKGDKRSFIQNLQLRSHLKVVKIDLEKGEVKSFFSWIVGAEDGVLYLNKDTKKNVKMLHFNENRVEIYDERDWDFIGNDGLITSKRDEEVTDSDNME